jgi:hypothetical protein
VDSEVAVLDYPSGWAAEGPGRPSADMGAFDEIRRWYGALWRAGDRFHGEVTVPPGGVEVLRSSGEEE